MGIAGCIPGTVQFLWGEWVDLLPSRSRGVRRKWRMLLYAVWWSIWKERNEVVFAGGTFCRERILHTSFSLWFHWIQAQDSSFVYQGAEMQRSPAWLLVCRKCIYKKLDEEELECCPICNIDLGGVPLEKLRPDHTLQDVRAKIFPLKRRKVEAPEVAHAVTLPARRKERSLSSLVVSTPKVLVQTTTTGRRTKPISRKSSALRGPSFPNERLVKKEENPMEDHSESSSSPETLKRFFKNAKQTCSAEHGQSSTIDAAENGTEAWDGKSDLWQPLNCLVEVANRTKSFKSNSHASNVKLEHSHVSENDPLSRKTKVKETIEELKLEDEKHNTNAAALSPTEVKKLRRIRRRKAAANRDSGIPSQALLDVAVANQERRICPVWFSLVASADQEGEAALPQIPSSYLRIKDGNAPVSCIQKYLKKKLNLTSETEVEIKCMGQPILSTLLMYNLIDLWLLQTAVKSDRVQVSVGSSAKEFVMVLSYSRKV